MEETFRLALDRLEGQIVKSKELSHDREFAKEYLREISVDITVQNVRQIGENG